LVCLLQLRFLISVRLSNFQFALLPKVLIDELLSVPVVQIGNHFAKPDLIGTISGGLDPDQRRRNLLIKESPLFSALGCNPNVIVSRRRCNRVCLPDLPLQL
jgi:hypothetical protein